MIHRDEIRQDKFMSKRLDDKALVASVLTKDINNFVNYYDADIAMAQKTVINREIDYILQEYKEECIIKLPTKINRGYIKPRFVKMFEALKKIKDKDTFYKGELEEYLVAVVNSFDSIEEMQMDFFEVETVVLDLINTYNLSPQFVNFLFEDFYDLEEYENELSV